MLRSSPPPHPGPQDAPIPDGSAEESHNPSNPPGSSSPAPVAAARLPRSFSSTQPLVQIPSTKRPLSALRNAHREMQPVDFATAASSSTGMSDDIDVPVFSSDPVEQGIDVADEGRPRKRVYRGTWWGEEKGGEKGKQGSRMKVEKGRREGLERCVDSGVWMGSEDTLEETFDAEMNIGHDGLNASGSSFGPIAVQRKIDDVGKQGDDSWTEVTREFVDECVERGEETIDLSRMPTRNGEIPSRVIEPLKSFTVKVTGSDPPQIRPTQLQMFLSNIALRRLPSILFQLRNITVLSLRGNNLTELPPSIANLVNLVELNISCNQLRYLPYELLSLLRSPDRKLKHFFPTPNPFFVPFENGDLSKSQITNNQQHGNNLKDTESSAKLFFLRLCYLLYLHAQGHQKFDSPALVAATPISEFDMSGTQSASFPDRYKSTSSTSPRTPPSLLPPSVKILEPLPPPPPPTPNSNNTPDNAATPSSNKPRSRVPSLFSLALTRLANSTSPTTNPAVILSALGAAETASNPLVTPRVLAALRRACQVRAEVAHQDESPSKAPTDQAANATSLPLPTCPTCSRPYVTPRAERIEYWTSTYRNDQPQSPACPLPAFSPPAAQANADSTRPAGALNLSHEAFPPSPPRAETLPPWLSVLQVHYRRVLQLVTSQPAEQQVPVLRALDPAGGLVEMFGRIFESVRAERSFEDGIWDWGVVCWPFLRRGCAVGCAEGDVEV